MEASYPAARVTRLVGLEKNSLYETELPGKHEAYVGFEMGNYNAPNENIV